MKPYVPSTRIAVRESIDEDLSDDIEDDVFIRDGKSIKVTFKIYYFVSLHTGSCNSVFNNHRYTDVNSRQNLSYLPEKMRDALYEKCPVAY